MRAHHLNETCRCDGIDRDALRAAVPALDGLCASTPVFLSTADEAAMAEVVAAVEVVVDTPGYQAAVLRDAVSRHAPGTRGAFLGFDFHLTPDGPRLIEVNTNPGGVLVNAALSRAQRACCAELLPRRVTDDVFVDVLLAEWEAQRGHAPLRTVAIVDEAPEQQAMYAEFGLFADRFRAAGLSAVIAPPDALAVRDGALWAGDARVDLVYNRLTDFALRHAPALRAAWLDDLAVVTPNPRAHALYADKRDLVFWSDPDALIALGVPEAAARALARAVPRTVEVTAANADALWADRKRWFFKPFAGFGSRATYRGDKITTARWADVAAGGYVAQALVPPSVRAARVADADVLLKLDVRATAWRGVVVQHFARLYQGQTTNLRTPGGGFAPVVVLADPAEGLDGRERQ